MNTQVSNPNERLLEHLVRLSGLRRRDDLLGGLTQALADTISAQAVAIFSLAHDNERRFWLALTEVTSGSDIHYFSDPMGAAPDTLLPIEDAPDRMHCLDRVEVVVRARGRR